MRRRSHTGSRERLTLRAKKALKITTRADYPDIMESQRQGASFYGLDSIAVGSGGGSVANRSGRSALLRRRKRLRVLSRAQGEGNCGRAGSDEDWQTAAGRDCDGRALDGHAVRAGVEAEVEGNLPGDDRRQGCNQRHAV